MLIAWGKNDKIFPAEGAEPYKRDLKTLQFHLLDAGHFALESNGEEIVKLMREFLGKHVTFPPAPVLPLVEQPPAGLVVDAPHPASLARGLVVVRYRTENLRIVPGFGPAALAVSPRLGHLHVTLDDALWHWVDARGDPLIVQGLPPGRHKLLIELADPTHKAIDAATVEFDIPRRAQPHPCCALVPAGDHTSPPACNATARSVAASGLSMSGAAQRTSACYASANAAAPCRFPTSFLEAARD